MGKPVLCLQTDKAAMLGERRREQFEITDSDLPFEIMNTTQGLLESLEQAILNDFELSYCTPEIVDRFLPYRDHRNCERAFFAINDISDVGTKGLNTSSNSCAEEKIVLSQIHLHDLAEN